MPDAASREPAGRLLFVRVCLLGLVSVFSRTPLSAAAVGFGRGPGATLFYFRQRILKRLDEALYAVDVKALYGKPSAFLRASAA